MAEITGEIANAELIGTVCGDGGLLGQISGALVQDLPNADAEVY